ncbi:MAG: hypothetical protein WDA06_01065 [Phenylobacterium sp.]
MKVDIKKIHFRGIEVEVNKCHEGFFSDIYVFEYAGAKYLVKYYKEKKESTKFEDISRAQMFKNELDGLQRLGSVLSPYVLTPEVVDINNNKLYFVQTFHKMTSFNRHLASHSNFFRQNKALQEKFFNLGEYLSQLHQEFKIDANTAYIHGDLNNKNIGFTADGRIFIYDPVIYPYLFRDSPYADVARFLLNLYPNNPRYIFCVSGRKKLIKSFLLGYIQNNPNFSLNALMASVQFMAASRHRKKMKNAAWASMKAVYITSWHRFVAKIIIKHLQDITL